MKQLIDSCEFNSPSGTLFSTGHTWIRKNDYGLIKLGIDEVTINILGDTSLNGFSKKGTYLSKGDFLFEINSQQKKIRIYSPISGTLEFINPFIIDKIITDPYMDDWAALIRAQNIIEEQKALMIHEEYKTMILSEKEKLGSNFESEYIYKSMEPFGY